MAHEPLLGRRKRTAEESKLAAERELRLSWPRVPLCGDDGKGVRAEYQPSPDEDSLFREYADGRFWEHAVKEEWKDRTIGEVETYLFVYPTPTFDLLDVDKLDKDRLEETEFEITMLSTCARYRRACMEKSSKHVKWCSTDRELFVERLKYLTLIQARPPAMWPGVTHARKATALAHARATEGSGESKADDRL
mmetsp:Transcript_851/g.2625  ORF Transcript_851/g.2625 Transcript_851/m.2625 type:complete len:193 (-) Transcript_851:163-741(-)